VPLYEYRCDACGHTFEKIQKFSDPLETVCPKCGGPVHKLASSPAIQFKGSGFYITDYAKKDSASAKFDRGKSEPGKSESGKSEAGKSEAGKSEAGKADGKSAASEKSTTAETKTETSSAKRDTPAAASKDTKSS
jgi:putative FmdB family regulatory protein